MVRRMSGLTRIEMIRNEYNMKGSIGVISIVENIRKNRLRWFGHVLRREKKGNSINIYGNECC